MLRNSATGWNGQAGHSGHESATWHLEPDYGSVKVARELTMAVLRDWSFERVASDAELVVSELVTNALRHAVHRPDTAPHEVTIQLSALWRDDEFVCAVRDTSDQLPSPREPDFLAETGRGLHLVSCFSRDWGAVPAVPCGKFVWALFSRRPL